MPFGVYKRGGFSYSLKKCFSLATDVFHTHDFSDFLRKLAPPCAAPAGGRCIDDQGRPITPIPRGCYKGSFCWGTRPSPGLCWDLPVSTVKGIYSPVTRAAAAGPPCKYGEGVAGSLFH
jgi:hypothetical protein